MPESSAAVAAWLPQALRGVSRVPSVRFGMPERSSAVAAWLPQSAAKGFKGAIRPFRNARKECCGSSLASPKRREGFQGAVAAWLPQSAARGFQRAIRPFRNARKECCGGSLASPKGAIRPFQKGVLRWQPGFPKAPRGVSRVPSVRIGMRERSGAVAAWLPQSAAKGFKGAIRPFRNARKECCGGSLASPKRREGFQGCHPSVSECQKGVLRWQPGFPKAPRGVSRVPSVRFGMRERSAAVAAWLPQSAARGFKGAIRREMFQGCHPSVSECQKRSSAVAAWLPQSAARGFKGAIRPFQNARKECCCSSLASRKRREGFKGAIRPFRNARKECCGGSLASPKRREGFQTWSCCIGKNRSVPHLRWSQAPPCLGKC